MDGRQIDRLLFGCLLQLRRYDKQAQAGSSNRASDRHRLSRICQIDTEIMHACTHAEDH